MSENEGSELRMQEKAEKVLTVSGCVLWISGLAAFIVGINMTGSAGTWVSVAGNIAFLAGLMIVGVIWLKRRKNRNKPQNDSDEKGEKESAA